MSEILARRSLRNEHLRKPHGKESAPAKQHEIWREIFTSSRMRTKLRFIFPVCGNKGTGAGLQNTEKRTFVVDSGASMRMLSKKDLSSDEMDTLRRSRNPTTLVTANGEVQTNEEAQVYVKDHDLFITVQLLEETPAVLSLGKFCSEYGCSYEWKNGETPRLTPYGKTIACITNTFVLLVVPRLSSSSSSSSASTSRPKDQSNSSGESETSSDPMTTRSAKQACGKPMQTNPDKLGETVVQHKKKTR